MNNKKIGQYNVIGSNVKLGVNVTIGNFCVLHDGVIIGDNTVIKDYVELRSGTHIGSECIIDSRVSSSGNCKIGNGVTLRYDTIIARGCEIGDNTYVCPRVMTNNLDSGGQQIGGAKVGENCFIGTNAVLQHGIVIGNDVTIGAMSFVNKDCEDNSVMIGTPAKKIEK